MNALRNVLAAVVPGGTVLDLQTVRPPPRIEAAGREVGELDATEFFARADANDSVLLRAVESGVLELELEEHFDVLERWPTGAALVADAGSKLRKIPPAMRSVVETIDAECVIRERCRTRRLRIG